MSKLDELLASLCPDGVEYKKLKDILKIRNGSDYKSFPKGNIPVYGSGGIMAYIDRFAYDKPTVLIPRKGSIDKLYYVDTPFWNVDTVFYTEIFEDVALPRYVYHCLLKEHLEQYNIAGGVPSLTQTVLNNISIPVPPLPIQTEIVRILDTFTEHTAELQAELQARRQQYEYYRNSMLTFDSNNPLMEKMEKMGEKVEWKKLGDVVTCNIKSRTGATVAAKMPKGNIPFFTSGNNTYMTNEYIVDGENLFINDGGTADIKYYSGFANYADHVISLKCRGDVATKFLYYVLCNNRDYINEFLFRGSGIKNIQRKEFFALSVPIPPLHIQKEIVRTLDKFSDLCSDISAGLPAEIASRQKQYEFYRDKLLAFDRKVS